MSRLLLRWNRSRYLRIAKMLAWVIKQREHAGEQQLWRRMDTLYKPVSAKVAGVGISWNVVLRYTVMTQGISITANKLVQRADKAERYCEFTPEKDAVVAAYESLVALTCDSQLNENTRLGNGSENSLRSECPTE